MGMDMNAPMPTAARVVTTALFIITIGVLAICLTRRVQRIDNWLTLSVPGWLIIVIYADSMLFVISTTMLEKSFNLNASERICDGAIILCLSCYLSTKILIYFFLVEKVYVIRNPWTPRKKDKMYMMNVCALGVYGVLVVLAFMNRISHIADDGMCAIGIDRPVLIPLTVYEMMLNIYLTSLFLAPLRKLHSFNHGPANHRLRKMATRTLVGSCVTLTSTCVNFGVLAGLDGEPGWICLMLCNLDILSCILVLHWATSLDNSISSAAEKSEFRDSVPASGASPAISQAPIEVLDFDRMVLKDIDLRPDLKPDVDVTANTPETTETVQVQEVEADVKDVEKGVVPEDRKDSQT